MPFAYEFEEMTDVDKAVWELSTRLPLTDLFVNRPCSVILAGVLVLVGITGYSIWQDLFQVTEPSARDYLIWDAQDTFYRDMKNLAIDTLMMGDTSDDPDSTTDLQSSVILRWSTMIIYEAVSN
jgi:hypothetical protein